MMKRLTSLLAIALLVTATACGDDDNKGNASTNNTSTNNTSTNNTSTNNTSTNNTSTNNTSTNNTSTNNTAMAADVTEVEPNGFAEGDTPTPFDAGQSIGGTIAEGSGDTSDIDRFSFTGQAGQVLTIEVLAQGDGTLDLGTSQLGVAVVSEDESVIRQLIGSEGLTSREVFLPYDSTYFVEVFDERGAGDALHGGTDATYVVGTSISALEPEAIALPATVDTNANDGTVKAFTLNSAEATAVVVETFAQRLDTPSALDTALVVFDPATSTVVAENDDILFTEEEQIFDSRLAFSAEANTDYLVIMDPFLATSDAAFTIETSVTDDAPGAPTVLTVGSTESGNIAEAGNEFDTDFFEITLQRNEIARIEVNADDQLQPAMTVSVGGQLIAEARPVNGAAAVEIAAGDFEDPQTFQITLDDFRNTPPDDGTPADVGGAGFNYTVEATSVTWTPTAISLPYSMTGTVADVGNINWYSFDVASGDVLVADVITTETDFSPVLTLLVEENYDVPLEAPFVNGVTEQTTFTMGVRDEFYRGSATAEYLVDFSVITPAAMDETEPNDDASQAEDISPPTRINGTLSGTNETDFNADFFDFSANAGQTVLIYTEPGTDMASDDADTILTLLDSNGTELDNNDDVAFGNTFSRISYEVPADGSFTIRLDPYCGANECTGGDYSMVVVAY